MEIEYKKIIAVLTEGQIYLVLFLILLVYVPIVIFYSDRYMQVKELESFAKLENCEKLLKVAISAKNVQSIEESSDGYKIVYK